MSDTWKQFIRHRRALFVALQRCKRIDDHLGTKMSPERILRLHERNARLLARKLSCSESVARATIQAMDAIQWQGPRSAGNYVNLWKVNRV